MRERDRHDLTVDGHPDFLEFRALFVRSLGPRRPLIRAKMRALKETSSFDLGSLGETMRRDFAAAAASEAEVAEAIVRVKAECGYLADPHTACAIVAAERELADGHAAAQVVLSTAHPAKFPDAMRGDHRRAPGACRTPGGDCSPPRSASPPSTTTSAPPRRTSNLDARGPGGPRMTRRADDAWQRPEGRHRHMRNLETVSLGLWVGTGARHETDREHGISHFLEHMAFKGTRTRSAQQIAEEIEEVGGELNAATSLETTAYFARVLKATTAWRSALSPTSCRTRRSGARSWKASDR